METLTADLNQALEYVDTRRYTLLQWPTGTLTNVSAYETRGGWEVFCWSSVSVPGIDFDDVIKFPLEEFVRDTDDDHVPSLINATMARSKKYALMLYEITVARVEAMGARQVQRPNLHA